MQIVLVHFVMRFLPSLSRVSSLLTDVWSIESRACFRSIWIPVNEVKKSIWGKNHMKVIWGHDNATQIQPIQMVYVVVWCGQTKQWHKKHRAWISLPIVCPYILTSHTLEALIHPSLQQWQPHIKCYYNNYAELTKETITLCQNAI